MRDPLHVRVLALLLRLYPASFRDRHGDDVIASARSAARRPGGGRPIAVVLDCAVTLGRAWLHAVRVANIRRLRGPTMDHLFSDLAYGLRTLAKRPGFTAVAVITLAFGIGATTAIFSVVSNVLLQTLPYDAPDRVVQVWNPWSNEVGVSRARSPMSSLDYADARDAIGSFEQLAAYAPQSSINLTGTEVPERVLVTSATASLFEVLGSSAMIGRTFTTEEDAPGRNDVVVLSQDLWQRRFGGDASVLGSIIRLDGVTHRVVGIMPPSFRLPEDYGLARPTEIFKPLALDMDNLDRANQWLHAIARLKPGVRLTTANAELESLTRWWIEQGFKIKDLAPYYAVPIEDELFGRIRPALLILFGAVAFVLLIACGNVASLVLARVDGRRAEVALRSALGAARSRIFSQLLSESVVLALIGGGAGLLLAYLGVEALVALEPANIPRVDEVRIDAATLGFTAVVALATSIVFGLVPALRASRQDLMGELRSHGGTATDNRRRQRLRGGLVVAEVALSVVLVIGAALMIRTFGQLSGIDLGFDPGGVLTFGVSLPSANYGVPEDRIGFYAQLVRELENLPAVQSAGAAEVLPLTALLGGGSIEVDGMEPPRPGEGLPNARWQVVTSGYLETMRYPRVTGRLIEAADRADGLPVVVVNETMAETFWPGQTAVGKRVRNTNRDVPWFTVVGVVRDVRHSGVIDASNPTMYFALEQFPLTRAFTPAAMSFAIRTSSSPLALTDAVRGSVRALDENLPVYGMRTMDSVVADELAESRFTMLLLTTFAAIALTLAAVGIYSLLSYVVSQRRKEIGVRVALGAAPSSVLSLVIQNGMRLAVLGLGAGLVAALFLTHLMESMLYGVRPLDPAVFLLVPALFGLVALAAAYIPARRATSVDAMLTLRNE